MLISNWIQHFYWCLLTILNRWIGIVILCLGVAMDDLLAEYKIFSDLEVWLRHSNLMFWFNYSSLFFYVAFLSHNCSLVQARSCLLFCWCLEEEFYLCIYSTMRILLTLAFSENSPLRNYCSYSQEI
ncbi:hypothetical protein PIB30_065376 [Stylosanthes scabra]|uniref:Uncharacterized protein n=1 Tax=Stylosanthes scabra TaxID=79078 RepID=A0ABU6ZKS1_9FABA|nr:hypothetical protein [Stylosanthes scabra]